MYVTVWRRGGDTERSFALPGGDVGDVREDVQVEVLHPRATTATAEWDGSKLRLSLPEASSAVLLRLTTAAP